MAELPGVLMPHRVTAEKFLGDGSEGPSWSPVRVSMPCRTEGVLTVTADGQHVGNVKVYTRLMHAEVLNQGARVTFRDGTRGTVSAVARHDDGGLGAWQHLEIVVSG